jgi:hypothetical protein
MQTKLEKEDTLQYLMMVILKMLQRYLTSGVAGAIGGPIMIGHKVDLSPITSEFYD